MSTSCGVNTETEHTPTWGPRYHHIKFQLVINEFLSARHADRHRRNTMRPSNLSDHIELISETTQLFSKTLYPMWCSARRPHCDSGDIGSNMAWLNDAETPYPILSDGVETRPTPSDGVETLCPTPSDGVGTCPAPSGGVETPVRG